MKVHVEFHSTIWLPPTHYSTHGPKNTHVVTSLLSSLTWRAHIPAAFVATTALLYYHSSYYYTAKVIQMHEICVMGEFLRDAERSAKHTVNDLPKYCP